MVVVTSSPLTVNINGDITASVAARSLTSDVLAVGATGFALWAPPLPPLVFTASSSADTGWVNLSYIGGFTAGTPGQLAYRKIGPQVTIRGGATHPTAYTTSSLEAVANLPSGIEPVSTVRLGKYGTSLRPAACEITSGGQILCGKGSDPTGGAGGTYGTLSWVPCNATYLVN